MNTVVVNDSDSHYNQFVLTTTAVVSGPADIKSVTLLTLGCYTTTHSKVLFSSTVFPVTWRSRLEDNIGLTGF